MLLVALIWTSIFFFVGCLYKILKSMSLWCILQFSLVYVKELCSLPHSYFQHATDPFPEKHELSIYLEGTWKNALYYKHVSYCIDATYAQYFHWSSCISSLILLITKSSSFHPTSCQIAKPWSEHKILATWG